MIGGKPSEGGFAEEKNGCGENGEKAEFFFFLRRSGETAEKNARPSLHLGEAGASVWCDEEQKKRNGGKEGGKKEGNEGREGSRVTLPKAVRKGIRGEVPHARQN